MAPAVSTTLDPRLGETEVLDRLLRLYEDEKQLYAQVLDLSRRQGEALASCAPVAEVRRLLEAKRNCLAAVQNLEKSATGPKQAWERGRGKWSAGARARLNVSLRTVGRLIEETLACEERNDQILLQQAKDV